MGNTSGALGFVEGLMGGMQRREEHDRNKKLDNLLDQKSQQNLLSDVGAYETHLNEGGDPMNWVFQKEQEDPFLMKQFKKLGNWMTGTEPADKTDPYAAAREQYANRDVEEGSMSRVPDAPSGKLVDYADGGTVGEEEERTEAEAVAVLVGEVGHEPLRDHGVEQVVGGAARQLTGAGDALQRRRRRPAGQVAQHAQGSGGGRDLTDRHR